MAPVCLFQYRGGGEGGQTALSAVDIVIENTVVNKNGEGGGSIHGIYITDFAPFTLSCL